MIKEKKNIRWNCIEGVINFLLAVGYVLCIINNVQSDNSFGIILDVVFLIAFTVMFARNIREIVRSNKAMKAIAAEAEQCKVAEPISHKDVIFSWDYYGE